MVPVVTTVSSSLPTEVPQYLALGCGGGTGLFCIGIATVSRLELDDNVLVIFGRWD